MELDRQIDYKDINQVAVQLNHLTFRCGIVGQSGFQINSTFNSFTFHTYVSDFFLIECVESL